MIIFHMEDQSDPHGVSFITPIPSPPLQGASSLKPGSRVFSSMKRGSRAISWILRDPIHDDSLSRGNKNQFDHLKIGR